MLPTREIRKIAKARVQDAEILHGASRYDGAAYLCGYAVELALKARICRTLKWQGYPSTSSEFSGLTSFKVHDLDLLLRLSGRAERVKSKYLAEWSAVLAWKPEDRYSVIGTTSGADARLMIDSARLLLKHL